VTRRLRLGNFATAEQLQSLRQEMGLDKPSYERYVLYLGGLLRGDMGRSWRTGNLVLDDLQARLPMSLELGICSMLLGIAIGIPIGVWGAASTDSVAEYGGKAYGIIGVAMPLFWGGLVLVYLFYFKFGIAPAPTGRIDMLVSPPRHLTGSYLLDSLLTGNLEALLSSAARLVLPVITLAFVRSLDSPHDLYLHAQSPGLTIHSGEPHLASRPDLVYKFALKMRSCRWLPDWFAGGFSHWRSRARRGGNFPARYRTLCRRESPVLMISRQSGVCLFVLVVYLLINLIVDLLRVLNPQVHNR
jgi:ABC-type dipeptide/oligopeptide/nickel transport system permease component